MHLSRFHLMHEARAWQFHTRWCSQTSAGIPLATPVPPDVHWQGAGTDCKDTNLPCRTCTQMSPAMSSGRARSCQADCSSNGRHMSIGLGLARKTVGILKMMRRPQLPGLARGRSRALQMPGPLLCSRLQGRVAAVRQLSPRCGDKASRLYGLDRQSCIGAARVCFTALCCLLVRQHLEA